MMKYINPFPSIMQPLADKLRCAGVWRHVRFVLSGQGQVHVTDVLE